MFVRIKKVGPYQHLQVAQSRRERKRVKQSILATLGRLDKLTATVVSTGPALIFERLWRETGCRAVVRKLLATRHHHFDVERAVFMTVAAPPHGLWLRP